MTKDEILNISDEEINLDDFDDVMPEKDYITIPLDRYEKVIAENTRLRLELSTAIRLTEEHTEK